MPAITATVAMLIATGATRLLVDFQCAPSEVPSRSAKSAGAMRKLSAMVSADAAARSRTKPAPDRSGSMAWKAAATSRAGVEEPATLITSARQRYRSTIHAARYETAGMANAGAGPRKPTASIAATNAAETVNCAKYRAATSSAITALIANTAANGLTSGAAGDRVK